MSLVEVEPSAWDDVLDRLGVDDAYFRRGYVESAALLDAGEPVLLHGGDAVHPVLVREIPGSDPLDVTTAYGFGGPVGGDCWDLYDRWAAERGVVTSFIRFHPLYANHRGASPSVRLEPLAGTVGWRLDKPDLFAGMHRSHRNKCRKAERAGVSVEVSEAPERLDRFAALYERTMARVDAEDFYFFRAEYWEALAAGLRARVVQFDAVLDGESIASALCLSGGPWFHYHLGASLDEARRLGASNLLLYEAGAWAKERGFELFHLGGGVGGGADSLLAFKRCFDPEAGLCERWLGKVVHDEEAYRALGGDAASLDGFFPAYRVPGALSQTAGTPNRR